MKKNIPPAHPTQIQLVQIVGDLISAKKTATKANGSLASIIGETEKRNPSFKFPDEIDQINIISADLQKITEQLLAKTGILMDKATSRRMDKLFEQGSLEGDILG